ncbi:MAG TPA: serine/threonine-protein kinase [Ktedonosporobacter sp.]|jgi:serine/threonine protein kinase|nr:serine/threonine-protein kinase [Ktedonosporobacter sp.]
MSLPSALAPGTTIGNHYIVGNLINRGGFGAVYRGVDTSEGGRPCAIKETYDVTPAARRQALMEASVLFTIRSKHLPEIYDALEANGRFYLIMQLIEGQNLLELLRSRVPGGIVGEQEPYRQAKSPCSEQEVLSWLLPIIDVLQELHSRNPPVLHRDIKPGNIILTPQYTSVLVDFGLTKLYDPVSSTQTIVKAVSEGFSPIEQYLGKTSPQSDIYAMAATMYLLLTNRLPPAAISRASHDDLLPPRQIVPAISPKMERVLLKGLAVNADQRFQSMSEFAQALRNPAFTAFADPTIAVAPVGGNGHVQTTRSASPPSQRSAPPPPPAHSYPAVPQSPRGGYSPPSPVYPVPQGYVMVPQSAFTAARPLPTPFGQGCLWGLVQGVLSGLMVALMPKQEYFFLAIVMGFLFYMLAGFTATRRGGGSLRGAWAGYWAGIISTVMFWIVLFITITIRVAQFMQAQRRPATELGRIWRSFLPDILKQPPATTQGQSPWSGLLILILGGLLLAFILGWIGGMFGSSQYKANMQKKQVAVKP